MHPRLAPSGSPSSDVTAPPRRTDAQRVGPRVIVGPHRGAVDEAEGPGISTSPRMWRTGETRRSRAGRPSSEAVTTMSPTCKASTATSPRCASEIVCPSNLPVTRSPEEVPGSAVYGHASSPVVARIDMTLMVEQA